MDDILTCSSVYLRRNTQMSQAKFTGDSPVIKSVKRQSARRQKAEQVVARRSEMLDLKIKGLPDKDIAEQYQLTIQHTQRELKKALRLTTKKAEKQAMQYRNLILSRYETLYSEYYPLLERHLDLVVKGEAELNYQTNVVFDNLMRIMKEMRHLLGTDPQDSILNINNTQNNLTIEETGIDPRATLLSKLSSISERGAKTIINSAS